MKKTLSKILVSLCMLGVFLAPLATQVQAQETNNWYFSFISTDEDVFTDVGPFTETVCKNYKVGDLVVTGGDTNFTNYIKEITESCHPGETGNSLNLPTAASIEKNPGIDFGCGFTDPFACIVVIFYHALFEPLAWITKGAAKILDYFVYYSTSDESYRNVFVEKGWGTVRDIANVMFIIGLLFVAIKTILNLNTTNNKKMLGNIIIFALLINFSLFATQVIVDASNILAKVFYHQIKPVDSNGVQIEENVEQRSVTVGLVDKFEPQKLLHEGTNSVGEELQLGDRTAQTFLVIVLLIVLMAFMIYIFISVSFLFVARTVSIWLAMILAPLAFASHAVGPGIKGIGWNEWLPNLLKSAFMAPIFIFFLYIIILFGDLFAVGGVSATGGEDTNIAAFMATFIPFMLIFVLLKKAKDLAVSYSGEMGSAMTKLGGGLTALALGGAALGTAVVGRNTVGAVSKYVQNDNARKKATSFGGFKDQWSKGGLSRYNPFAYVKEAGKFMTAGVASGIHKIPTTTSGVSLGKAMQNADKSYGKQQHSAHVLEEKSGEMAGKFGLKKDTIKYGELTEDQQKQVRESIDKDTISKKTYNKKFETLDAEQARSVEDASKIVVDGKLEYTIDAIFKDPNSPTGAYKTERIIATDNQNTKNANMNLANTKVIDAAEGGVAHETQSKQNAGMGEFVRATRTGSFDPRELSKTVVNSKGFLAKLTVGIVAAVALGMRTGVKTSLGSSYGTSSKDMTKDMGKLIMEALKDMKVEIKTDSGGGGHAKPSGGGGHGGGH